MEASICFAARFGDAEGRICHRHVLVRLPLAVVHDRQFEMICVVYQCHSEMNAFYILQEQLES